MKVDQVSFSSLRTKCAIFYVQLNRWCEEAGGDIMINFLNREENQKLTDISDSNPFWMAFKNAVDDS